MTPMFQTFVERTPRIKSGSSKHHVLREMSYDVGDAGHVYIDVVAFCGYSCQLEQRGCVVTTRIARPDNLCSECADAVKKEFVDVGGLEGNLP